MSVERSGFRAVGDEETVAENRWFTVRRQPVDFVNRASGAVIRAAAQAPGDGGGEMNWVDVTPGSLIVGIRGNSSSGQALLVPQERWTTNLIEGKPAMHCELPGGAFEDGDQDRILASAERELREEAGVTADDFQVVGPARGHMPHPLLTDRNVTVVARGVRPIDGGATPEDDEVIGAPEWHSWDDAAEMYMNPNGLYTPHGFRVISSAPSIASLHIAQRWLRQQEDEAPFYST